MPVLNEHFHTDERAGGSAILQRIHPTSPLERQNQHQHQQLLLQQQHYSDSGCNEARSSSSNSSSSTSLGHLLPLVDEASTSLGSSPCATPSPSCPTPTHSRTSSTTTTTATTDTSSSTTTTSMSGDPACSTCGSQLDDDAVVNGGVKCLVTGGSGYVGLHLACSLVARGHSVVLFDLRPPSSLPPGCEEVGSISRSSSKEDAAAAGAAAAATAGAAAGGLVLPRGCTFVQGDLCDPAAVAAACAGVHSVFHVASYGMSGAESLRNDVIERVNVGGTSNLLRAAAAAGVRRFVHVSSYNAIWVRQTVRGGDEASSPCLPYECYPDAYSRTKSMAERMVLEANGTPTAAAAAAATCCDPLCCCSEPPSFPSCPYSSSSSLACNEHCCSYGDGSSPASPFTTTRDGQPTGGQLDTCTSPRDPNSVTTAAITSNSCGSDDGGSGPRLLTCAVRPPAIYGPGELRHTPRILSYARAGLLCFAFGSPESKTDWWVQCQDKKRCRDDDLGLLAHGILRGRPC